MYPNAASPAANQIPNGQPQYAPQTGAPDPAQMQMALAQQQGGQQFAPPPQMAPQPQIGGGYSGPAYVPQGLNVTQGNLQAAPPQQYQQVPVPHQFQQPQQHQLPVDPIIAGLRAKGYNVPFQTGDELLTALGENYDALQRMPRMEAMAQHAALQQMQPAPQLPAQQQQPQPGAWQPPAWDPTWERFLEVDERTGRFRPADPALITYAEAANRYNDWLRSQNREFWQNPYQFIDKGLRPTIEQELINPLQQRIQQLERSIEEYQLADALGPYEGALFARDQSGRINYGAPTPAGNAFENIYRQTAGMRDGRGVPLSVEQRVRFAMSQVQISQQQAAYGQPAAVPQQQPGYQPAPQQGYQPAPQPQYQPAPLPNGLGFQPTPTQVLSQYAPAPQVDQREAFLNRAYERAQQPAPQPFAYQPQQGGSFVNAQANGQPQNPTESFEAMAQQVAREMGVVL